MGKQRNGSHLTNPEPETPPPSLSPQNAARPGSETTQIDELPIAHALAHDPKLASWLSHYQQIEDRLTLASFPGLVFVLILWAIASAYPAAGTALNLLGSIGVIVITCLILVPLVEISWKLVRKADAKETTSADSSAYGWGAIGIWALICLLIGCLIAMIFSAGTASIARTALIILELVFLSIQCWRILRRYASPPEAR